MPESPGGDWKVLEAVPRGSAPRGASTEIKAKKCTAPIKDNSSNVYSVLSKEPGFRKAAYSVVFFKHSRGKKDDKGITLS